MEKIKLCYVPSDWDDYPLYYWNLMIVEKIPGKFSSIIKEENLNGVNNDVKIKLFFVPSDWDDYPPVN